MRVLAVGLCLVLGACAEVQLASHATKEAAGELYTTQELVGLGGHRKVGNPYQIAGQWYYPKEDPTYDETGIASWYGPGFHGRQTANGERFDQYQVSAAHTTLPMPSLVRVTNLENGRSMVVRINDRGPFAHGRIIDLSRRAAQLLGFEQQGTAKVRVQALTRDDPSEIQVAQAGVGLTPPELQSPITSAPRTAVTAEALPPPPPAATAPAATAPAATTAAAASPPATRDRTLAVRPGHITPVPVPMQQVAALPATDLEQTLQQGQADPSAEIFVQAGAFTERDNANRLSSTLASLGAAQVMPAVIQGVEYFRVRLGPMPDVATADRLLDQLARLGHTNARIVVN